MTERSFDPRSPGVRRFARAYHDAIDTVDVRLRPGRHFTEYEGFAPDGNPRAVVHEPGDIFSIPRSLLAEFVETGMVDPA